MNGSSEVHKRIPDTGMNCSYNNFKSIHVPFGVEFQKKNDSEHQFKNS